MHPDSELVEMFRSVRQDARAETKPPESTDGFAIDLGFDGGGQLPTVDSVMILPLGNLKARITGAVMVANGIGSAVIDLRLGTLVDVPLLAPIYRASTIPTLAAAAFTVLDTTDWSHNLQPDDVLIAKLMSVSGVLTCVTLSLACIRLKWPAGGPAVTDTTGAALTDTNGNVITTRS